MITVNMDKARAIRQEQLRRERVKPLAALDVAFQRALETGADVAPIIAEKQRLRDITEHPALLEATAPAELLAVTITAA